MDLDLLAPGIVVQEMAFAFDSRTQVEVGEVSVSWQWGAIIGARPDIEVLRQHGITNGCAATKFCPTDSVTRAEVAAFLVRAFDIPVGTQNPFTDDDESVFESDIAALEASGVTSGCAARLYCPDRAVTRGEMAAFLIRALALP